MYACMFKICMHVYTRRLIFMPIKCIQLPWLSRRLALSPSFFLHTCQLDDMHRKMSFGKCNTGWLVFGNFGILYLEKPWADDRWHTAIVDLHLVTVSRVWFHLSSFRSKTEGEAIIFNLKWTRAGTLTYYTEWFPCKAQSSLPSSITTTASSRPDTNNEFQTKDNNHDKFLAMENKKNVCYR